MSETRQFETAPEDEGSRLDKYLAAVMPELSRSRLQQLIDDGLVTIGLHSVKPSRRLKAGETVVVVCPDPVPLEVPAVAMPLDIIHEDEDILIINKPKGMVVHPAAGHTDDTLVNGILHHCGDALSGINGVKRPGIVHRIDKDTTGTLIICKNDRAHQIIAKQLKDHSITRRYRGIVRGCLKEACGTVDKPLARDKKDRKKIAVDPEGRRAVTHYRVVQHLKGCDDCEFTLETGRTHQIRVHMASLGHPLLGDSVYGPKTKSDKLQGQTLHAMTIGFRHPGTGSYVEYSADLPDYYKDLLRKLGGKL